MIVVICALLAVGAMGFTLFFREKDVPTEAIDNPEMEHLQRQREVLYENLRDLQFEYHQGKLSDDDYQSLKAGFQDDLAKVLASLEQMGPPVEIEKPAMQGKAIMMLKCVACGTVNEARNRFCGQCGNALS